jgi:hypothetical protein
VGKRDAALNTSRLINSSRDISENAASLPAAGVSAKTPDVEANNRISTEKRRRVYDLICPAKLLDEDLCRVLLINIFIDALL